MSKLEEYELVYIPGDKYGSRLPSAALHGRAAPSARARFAMAMMERWAPITGRPDGEDTAGRQKARVATAQEIVSHCCNVAEAAYDEFERRGWVIEFPDLETVRERAREEAERN